ncbi:hypothetical protein [Pelagicoccus mobilis]|uniref:DUF2007 domain-containing protein n=1 Tax=Pelagicoccus mobilis TaxID=415221 RepID=A0A934RZT5_9BACT|nr:hypothetical protein [Pelagicoccus mobilis]MBK1878565.1 hypothetical protein [Pelagicoccus mobilis]
MRVVARYQKADDAYLAASVLEGSGLSPHIRDGHTIGVDWFYSQAIGGVKLEVPEGEFEKAVELLGLPPVEEPTLKCPYCDSAKVKVRELSGVAALGIVLFGFAVPLKTRKADCLDCKTSLKVSTNENGEQVAEKID